MTPEKIAKLNSNNLTITKRRSSKGGIEAEELDIYINPNDPLERKYETLITYTDPSGQKYEIPNTRQPANFSEFYGKGLKGIFTGITNQNKIK